jgi:hypothetical protein
MNLTAALLNRDKKRYPDPWKNPIAETFVLWWEESDHKLRYYKTQKRDIDMNDTSQPSLGRNPYAAFEAQILEKVIGPILHKIITEKNPSTKQEIVSELASEYGANNITNARLTQWMDQLGYKIEKRTLFIRPGSPADEQVPPSDDHLGLPNTIREILQ